MLLNRVTEFRLTEDHLKLIKRMFIDWDDSAYEGAPAVGLKRPYGNSDVYFDVAEILADGSDVDAMSSYNRDGELKKLTLVDGREFTLEDLVKLHQETGVALQICTCTLSFQTGVYRKRELYNSLSWERVGDL